MNARPSSTAWKVPHSAAYAALSIAPQAETIGQDWVRKELASAGG